MASTSLADIKADSQGGASRDVSIFSYLDDPRVAKGIAAVAGKFLTPDRFLRLAVNAVKKTPLLLKCDTQSVLGAFMASAALGLEPNTVQQQAFLIPYKKRRKEGNQWVDTYECQFQIGYRGFVTLAYRSPQIASLQAEAIHKGDHFDHMMGSKSFLEYKKNLFDDRGALIGSFCFVKLESGAEVATVLPLSEIHKIRSKSETYNALSRAVDQAENDKDRQKAEQKLAETPWVMWEDDMAAKSAIKKQAKQLPLMPGDSMTSAAAIDDNSDRNVIDLKAMADPEVVRAVVQEGMDPPALSYQESERVPADFARTAEKQKVGLDQKTEQHREMVTEPNGEWRPDPAEEAAIRAREMEEANREQQGDRQQSGRRGRGQQQSFDAE